MDMSHLTGTVGVEGMGSAFIFQSMREMDINTGLLEGRGDGLGLKSYIYIPY